MVAQESFLGCFPVANEVCGCKKKCCGGKRYIQPLPPKSFKPERQYLKPTIPMDSGTVYKNSFHKIGPTDIQICRMKPYFPVNSLQPSKSKIDDHTIMKMSFPEYSEKCKRNPILPHKRSMLGSGAMQDYTTQKHDYVAKPSCKREAMMQGSNIKSSDDPMERDTVQKLSFIPPDAKCLSVAKSFKPIYNYKRPDVPMTDDTTHKLSFLPVCPAIKEEYPWAKKSSIPACDSPIESATTYKLSYIPNCGTQKSKPLRVADNRSLVTNAKSFDDHTIYKESFFGPGGYCKRSPILPTLQLETSDAKMNPDSVYHLSFPGHRDVRKSSPILPHSRFLLGRGPRDDLSTQRRDFVDKPFCRRGPILPICQMEKTDAPIENHTTMQLSFMQPSSWVGKSKPFRPKDGVTTSKVPMDSATIHKLSFVPVTAPKKEDYPWMKRQCHSSNCPMEFDTTQNMSFMPPGQVIDGGNGCFCNYPGECMSNNFPKADSF